MTSIIERRTIQEQAAEKLMAETEQSRRNAKRAQLAEREKLTAEFGIVFDPFRDGQLLRERTGTAA